MTILGQLAQSTQFQTIMPPIDFLSSASTLRAGLLGNMADQVSKLPSFINAAERYEGLFNVAQPTSKLALLKRRKFTSDGKKQRVARSLTALNAPQPTKLSTAEWKAILEEIEDED